MTNEELYEILNIKFKGQEPIIYAEYGNKCGVSLKSERESGVTDYNSQVRIIERDTGNVYTCRFSEIFK